MNFHMFKLDLEKAEEPDIKLPTSAVSSKKQGRRKTPDWGRSQDGGGIGRGDHFLFYKFIERTTER